jgi:hypothetical protein
MFSVIAPPFATTTVVAAESMNLTSSVSVPGVVTSVEMRPCAVILIHFSVEPKKFGHSLVFADAGRRLVADVEPESAVPSPCAEMRGARYALLG